MCCRCSSGRIWPKNSYVHTTFFNTVRHHLEIVVVVMRLWGLAKLIKMLWSFQKSLVFLIYWSRWLTTQIFLSGYLKNTIGSRLCPIRDCFNNSGIRSVTSSASNIIKTMFIYSNVWSLWPVVIGRRIARRNKRYFKLHCFKGSRLFIYLRTSDISHVVEYLGRADLKLKTTFKNLQTKSNFPNGVSFSVLVMVYKTDLTVFTDE